MEVPRFLSERFDAQIGRIEVARFDFRTVSRIWRRRPPGELVAPSMGERKGCFAAASAREQAIVPEFDDPDVALKPMKAGREVVEDYGHTGLTLRAHPVTFLRQDLMREKYMTCAAASAGRNGMSYRVAGLVLVRQKPGSANNVTFITLEDETGIANLVVWDSVYEKHRRTVLTASMLGVVGRIQREGEVVHVIAYKLIDLSGGLASIGGRDRSGAGEEAEGLGGLGRRGEPDFLHR